MSFIGNCRSGKKTYQFRPLNSNTTHKHGHAESSQVQHWRTGAQEQTRVQIKRGSHLATSKSRSPRCSLKPCNWSRRGVHSTELAVERKPSTITRGIGLGSFAVVDIVRDEE